MRDREIGEKQQQYLFIKIVIVFSHRKVNMTSNFFPLTLTIYRSYQIISGKEEKERKKRRNESFIN